MTGKVNFCHLMKPSFCVSWKALCHLMKPSFCGFSSAETSLLEKLKGLDDGQSEFLPPDEAFVLRTRNG